MNYTLFRGARQTGLPVFVSDFGNGTVGKCSQGLWTSRPPRLRPWVSIVAMGVSEIATSFEGMSGERGTQVVAAYRLGDA